MNSLIFLKKTQEDFKKVAEETRNPQMLELKTQADILALSGMLHYESQVSGYISDGNGDVDETNPDGKIFKKDQDLITAFIDDIPIAILHPNYWICYYICADKSIAEVPIESPNSEIRYEKDFYFYFYLYLSSKFLIDREVISQIEQKGHDFLAGHGVKLNWISRDEAYFEYTQKFIDGLFNDEYFKFKKKI